MLCKLVAVCEDMGGMLRESFWEGVLCGGSVLACTVHPNKIQLDCFIGNQCPRLFTLVNKQHASCKLVTAVGSARQLANLQLATCELG